jgi:hypothetical protein
MKQIINFRYDVSALKQLLARLFPGQSCPISVSVACARGGPPNVARHSWNATQLTFENDQAKLGFYIVEVPRQLTDVRCLSFSAYMYLH